MIFSCTHIHQRVQMHERNLTKARQWSESEDTFVLETDCTVGIRADKMRSGKRNKNGTPFLNL